MKPLRKSSLPGILAEIADVAGKDAAFKIAREYGGVRVTIPVHPRADHWLVRLVGEESARKICAHFAVGGADGRSTGLRDAVIPLGPVAKDKVARRLAAEGLKAGKAVRSVARDLGVHERTVWRVKKKIRSDDQGELF